MALRLTQADWDHLLDGEQRIIDLDVLGFDGGLAGFRALAYYQADKRRGRLKSKKLDSSSMTIQGLGCRPLRAAPPAQLPVFSPSSMAQPALQEQPPTTTVDRFAHDLSTDPSGPPMTVEAEAAQLSEADREALLLGPCSCGQSPTCLPACSRFS